MGVMLSTLPLHNQVSFEVLYNKMPPHIIIDPPQLLTGGTNAHGTYHSLALLQACCRSSEEYR